MRKNVEHLVNIQQRVHVRCLFRHEGAPHCYVRSELPSTQRCVHPAKASDVGKTDGGPVRAVERHQQRRRCSSS